MYYQKWRKYSWNQRAITNEVSPDLPWLFLYQYYYILCSVLTFFFIFEQVLAECYRQPRSPENSRDNCFLRWTLG